MEQPTAQSNSDNLSANIQYILDRSKQYEEKITYSTGRLFSLYAQNDDDIKKLAMIVRDQDREFRSQIKSLQKEVEGLKE